MISPFRSTRRRVRTLAFLLAQTLWLPAPAPAQEAKPEQKREQPAPEKDRKGGEPEKRPIDLGEIRANPLLLIKEPAPWRVYQRDSNNRADIPVVLDPAFKGARVVNASLVSAPVPAGNAVGVGTIGGFAIAAPFRNGKIVGVSPNLPAYGLNCTIEVGGAQLPVFIGPIFVGDLWVLAGQSNMEGVGNLDDVTSPSNHIALLGMDGRWAQAEEPLHWLVDSPDPVHSGDPASREERSKDEHRDRRKGAGLGLSFANTLFAATDVPIGLVACAHGGTSMAQWDPARKDEGGNSLYGSMLRQVNLAGGRVRGVLWYQGESDAQPGTSDAYPRTMVRFIASMRDDFHDPDLPFYLVQIGRFVFAAEPKGWNTVRDAQRRLPDRVPNTSVVASVDLALDDLIHVATPDLKRLGARLARVALRELFGQVGATTPTFDRVIRRDDTTLVVKFKGVNRVSHANGPRPLPPGVNAPPMLMPGGIGGPNPRAGSAGQPLVGFQPERHIAGFSIRKADGAEIPLIYDAAVGPTKDTVLLRLVGKPPEGAMLWYGYGLDPYCNLTDVLDMAVPAFGPIAIDEVE